MLGVDFVINALFETSGLRWEGDCARALFAPTASKTKATKEKIKDFTALILLCFAECKAAKHCRTPKRGRDCERIFLACVLECGGAPPLLDSLSQLASSTSSSNCRFKCRRAAFLIARRSAATASFCARRSLRVRVSAKLGKCEIFGRCVPTFRSFGFAYGSVRKFSASCSR